MVSTIIFALLVTSCICQDIFIEEKAAVCILKDANKKLTDMANRGSIAVWTYSTNLTEENLQNQINVSLEITEEANKITDQINMLHWRHFTNESLRRQCNLLHLKGPGVLSKDEQQERESVIADMTQIFSTSTICDYRRPSKCDLALTPDLENIMATSRDPDELKHVWVEWRNAVGPVSKESYVKYVNLSNKMAVLNNFTNFGAVWLDDYEDPNIKEKFANLWKDLKPLYEQLHAYVRFKLREVYGDIVSEKGPIPAHLLGNMWAQNWENIASITSPFPKANKRNLTEELRKQNYTILQIAEAAETFFTSVNLSAMTDTFWKKSIFVKPKDRDIVCHATAWNINSRDDFRLTMCAELNEHDFYTMHHEMGHIEYYMQYKDQPYSFRAGANPGFHEATGDLIALSALTNHYLRTIGLQKTKPDEESMMNDLYLMALSKVVILPYAYIIDFWRWNVFAGETTPDEYNCKWWDLRVIYQGVEPPVDRYENDFDPVSKYHVAAAIEYIRYFVSYVLQFQLHRSLCKIAGQYEPNNPAKQLHQCDIYNNTDAGNALKNMLSMGASKPWQETLESLTGQRDMDATALLEYFQPLYGWLVKENIKNLAHVGWEKSTKVCHKSSKVTASTGSPTNTNNLIMLLLLGFLIRIMF